LPAGVERGGTLAAALTWDNAGVAPLYERFDVTLELRRGDRTVWSGRSGLDLRMLLPAGTRVPEALKDRGLVVAPYTATEAFNLPASLGPGEYAVWVKVTDPASRGTELQRRFARLPLRLAHPGRSGDGAYPIGQLEIR
jgi:Domain of unknown function (DUF4832)